MQPIISAQNLVKTYGDLTAVSAVSFDIEKAKCIGLLGPNGAGKSTTIRMITGTTMKDSGELTIFGKPVEQLTITEKSKVGLVPQDDNLDPDLTVTQNLNVYGNYFGLPKKEIKNRVPELLQFMKLEEKSQAQVSMLSGGMKRRLVIARSLIADPSLLILDEPTTGLDPQARVMIWQRLINLKKQGKTLLLTTHYMDEAERLCDRIIIVDDGKVLDSGTPRELIKKHTKPHVFEISKPLSAKLQKCKENKEDIGTSVLFYVDKPESFQKNLDKKTVYQHRLANLEDVFLNLTGRSLRNG
jgi:lipooligosaccharide transport system ATP-binding protein